MAASWHTAYVALGSNLGNRRAHLEEAVASLGAAGTARVVACSSFHETDAVGGPPGQPKYLNAAVRIETELSPPDLLRELQRLEQAHGRVRGQPDAPRTLDLLLYDEQVIDLPDLTVPHPRMHERLFVLAPLVEIAPTYVHPLLERTLLDLYQAMKNAPSADDP
jgi:2-amino-4-hydroxy-6-hydroxymethyldihydropteridine diphosphokinase